MLDALSPAALAALEAVKLQQGQGSAGSGGDVAAAAARAARVGADATKSMAAQAGRSSYVPQEVMASVADPGAVGVATWIGAVAAALV